MQLVSTAASPSPELSFTYFLAGLAGMAAAAALLTWHPEALLTRWHPAALAAVHVFALAGLMPVMLGALMQFVPVACGLSLPHWGKLDWLLLLALQTGSGLLGAGFLSGAPLWLGLGGSLLLASLLLSAARLAFTLWHQRLQGELLAALRRNALALGMTLALATALLGSMLLGWNLPFLQLVDWHAQWGLIGWVGGLIASVAGVVVPMFHVSPPYPKRWHRALHSLLPLLLLSGLAALLERVWLQLASHALLALLCLGFGLLTGQRVLQARRGERDAFYWGWLALAAQLNLLAALGLLASLTADPRWGMAFGVLVLTGLGGGTISVMLYRIVPFLIWLHWQRANKARVRLPLLHQIIPARRQGIQLLTEASATCLLVASAFFPALSVSGALILSASKLGQFVLLAHAIHEFRKKLEAIKRLPPRALRDKNRAA